MRVILSRCKSSAFPFCLTTHLFTNTAQGDGQYLPCNVCKHCPVLISQIFTVESAFPETRMLSLSSIPLVSDWCPVSVWMQFPVSTSQTRIEVSRDPLTTWMPSNYNRHSSLDPTCGLSCAYLLTLILRGAGRTAWGTGDARNKMRSWTGGMSSSNSTMHVLRGFYQKDAETSKKISKHLKLHYFLIIWLHMAATYYGEFNKDCHLSFYFPTGSWSYRRRSLR